MVCGLRGVKKDVGTIGDAVNGVPQRHHTDVARVDRRIDGMEQRALIVSLTCSGRRCR